MRFPPANDTQMRLGVDETCDWTPFRLEKTANADVAVQKRNYRPSEAKWQADKARFRMTVNLSLVFTLFGALKD